MSSPDTMTNSYLCTVQSQLVIGLGTSFIKATLAYVTDPFHHIMIAIVQLWFKDFKVTNFQTRTGKGNLQKEKMKINQHITSAAGAPNKPQNS